MVRVNSSLFPSALLTISIRSHLVATGTTVDIAGVDARLHGRWGGDLIRLNENLTHDRPIDLFVVSRRSSRRVMAQLEEGGVIALGPGEDFLLLVSWAAINGEAAPGRIGLIWKAADRVSGRRPFVLHGHDARSLWEYATGVRKELPLGLRLQHPRAQPTTWLRSVRRRHRSQRANTMHEMNVVPSSARTITLRGIRGFRRDSTLALALPNGHPGSGLTIVVGANNAGKSTVWESFDALARKLKSDVSFSESRRNRLTQGGVRIRLDQCNGHAYVLESRNSDTSETIGYWYPEGHAPGVFEIISVPSRRHFQANFNKSMTSQRDWMTIGSDFSRSRQVDQFSQFSGRLFDLHNDEIKKERFDALMTDALGYSLDWTIDLADGQHGQSYYLKVRTGNEVNHTSEGLGDGIISLMFILNALYDSDAGTLLTIDEPELSLHPQLLRRLGKIISRFAADRQIVIFTHSPELVSWNDIAAGAEIARVFKVGHESKIAQVSRGAIDEITKARGGWKNPHALGLDANTALFLDDGVIVVEGQEDAALLPRVFDLLEVWPQGSVFGWGSGGAGNVRRILRLLHELGFERVAAMLDNNVPDTIAKLRADFPSYLVVEIPAPDIRNKPAVSRPATYGLLDERGKKISPELVDAARLVVQQVGNYLSSDAQRQP